MAKEDFNILDEDIVSFFNERVKLTSIPVDFKFVFIDSFKQKNNLIKISKLNDQMSFLLKSDILVSVNSDYYDNFDENTRKILFDAEIDKINFNLEKGTFKIGKPNFSTNRGIVDKYTYDEVERALEVQELYEKQKKDKLSEEKPNNKKK